MTFPRYFKEDYDPPLLLRFDSETEGVWLRTGTPVAFPMSSVTTKYLASMFTEITAGEAEEILRGRTE